MISFIEQFSLSDIGLFSADSACLSVVFLPGLTPANGVCLLFRRAVTVWCYPFMHRYSHCNEQQRQLLGRSRSRFPGSPLMRQVDLSCCGIAKSPALISERLLCFLRQVVLLLSSAMFTLSCNKSSPVCVLGCEPTTIVLSNSLLHPLVILVCAHTALLVSFARHILPGVWHKCVPITAFMHVIFRRSLEALLVDFPIQGSSLCSAVLSPGTFFLVCGPSACLLLPSFTPSFRLCCLGLIRLQQSLGH